jgi:hypothetical protein
MSDERPAVRVRVPSETELSFYEDLSTFARFNELVEQRLSVLPGEAFPEIDRLPEALRRRLRADVTLRWPRLGRYSAIVTGMMLFEEHGDALCEALHRERGLTLRLAHVRGDNLLVRFHRYVCRVAGLPSPDGWYRLRALHSLRNCIVHANGRVSRSREAGKLRMLLGHVDGYTIVEDRILLTLESARFATGVLISVFTSLYNAANLQPLSERVQ